MLAHTCHAALRRLEQEDCCAFRANLNYIVMPCLKSNQVINNNNTKCWESIELPSYSLTGVANSSVFWRCSDSFTLLDKWIRTANSGQYVGILHFMSPSIPASTTQLCHCNPKEGWGMCKWVTRVAMQWASFIKREDRPGFPINIWNTGSYSSKFIVRVYQVTE